MRLHGRVNREGVPVEGAYVQLLGPSGEFAAELRTDESGRFVFYPAPGAWSLRVLLPGGSRLQRDVILQPGQTADVPVSVDASDEGESAEEQRSA